MTRKERIKRLLDLLLEGNNRARIASALDVTEKDVAKWMADPEFLREARLILTDRLLKLIPKTLDRLEELLDSESDTQAMNAIKLIIKQLENAEDYDEELEKLRKTLEPVIAIILDVQEQAEVVNAELERNEGIDDEGNSEKTAG